MSLSELPFLASFFITIVLISGIAVLGLFIVRILMKIEVFAKEDIRIGTTICTIIGALYGLVLALLVINLWQDYKYLHEKTIEEAAHIDILYRDTDNLDPLQREQLRVLIRDYLISIINDSWPMLENGSESNKTREAYNKLDKYVLDLKMKYGDLGEEALKNNLIKGVNNLALFRKERVYYASLPRVPKNMWLIIFIGTVFAICSTYFLKIGSLKLQVIYTIMHSAMIGIIIFLIIELNHPFRGAIKIESFAFKKTLFFIDTAEKNL